MNGENLQPAVTNPHWVFDESRQIGRDYTEPAEVDCYDVTHADFRDFEAEARAAITALDVNESSVLLDIGCGTGNFALIAAQHCRKVIAMDVSPAMLAAAQAKAESAGCRNIEFREAGFLTCDIEGDSVDAITSTYALHHLPDLWKAVALRRILKMLKSDGRLYLRDVVVPESTDLMVPIASFILTQEKLGGKFLREDAEGHFRDEHSTLDWIMEGILAKAGFTLLTKSVESDVIATYLCQKCPSTTCSPSEEA